MQESDFIDKIRASLGVVPGTDRQGEMLFAPRVPGEAEALLEKVRARTRSERLALVRRLKQMALPINLDVSVVKDLPAASAAIVQMIDEKSPEWGDRKQVAAWRHPLIEKLNLDAALATLGVPVAVAPVESVDGAGIDPTQRQRFREAVEGSYVGVTSADFCVAESATLVLKTRPGQARSVSLVPSIHVAVIEERQMLASLKELYAILIRDPAHCLEGLTNCMTFISGPSKTADIEAHMVHGAHGPREVHLMVVGG
jgi:L-lactate dehydrogenase complex protein LldG